MQKTTVHFHSREPSGNIYCLLGRAHDALIRQNCSEEGTAMTKRVVGGEPQSYEQALEIINGYVELIDDGGLFEFRGGKCYRV